MSTVMAEQKELSSRNDRRLASAVAKLSHLTMEGAMTDRLSRSEAREFGTVTIYARVPAPLAARVREAAAARDVSVNAFAVAALEAALGADWQFMTTRKGRGK